jgi:dTDP-4-amino-4,6-dideoxygalactose transaminase
MGTVLAQAGLGWLCLMKVEKNSKVVLKKVSFNKVYLTGSELKYISEAINNSHLSGNGKFTKLSERFLSDLFSSETLLTSSCTHSLEMCAKLLDLGPEDEVIVPSFTFVSTANAFAQTGARPVFADIKLNDFNISIESAEKLITNKTKAICIVH